MNDISKDDNDQVNEMKADEPRHETKETLTPLQSHQDPRDQIIKEQGHRENQEKVSASTGISWLSHGPRTLIMPSLILVYVSLLNLNKK